MSGEGPDDCARALSRLDAATVGPACVVTGAAGYLGGHLVARLLALGCEVRAFDVRPYSGDARAEVVVGDVRRYDQVAEAVEGADVVFHTASVIDTRGFAPPRARRRAWDVNVLGTEHVVRACDRLEVDRLVHTSSINVAMEHVVDEGDESTPYATGAFDLYTQTKVAAERVVLAADDPGGLRTVALRPGGIWGGGECGLMVQRFIEQLAAGKFVALIGGGRSLVDNTHVENLVDAQLLAAAALASAPERVGGQAYFITDDERFNGLEWFRPLAEALGHRFPRARLPGRLMYAVGALAEAASLRGGPEPTLTRRGVLNLTQSSSFRIDKARRDLGYAPRVRRDDGLADLMPDARALYERAARRAS